jgi:hypothetical protein
MAEFEEPPITLLLAMYQQCLCDGLAEAGLPAPCFCGVLPGGSVANDYGDEGMAWVRLVTAAPSRQFPQQDDTWTPCAAPIAYTLEMGVLRCAPVFADSRGNPPSLEAQFETVRLQMADMEAMKKAIACCNTPEEWDVALGPYSPVGPDGGRVGGTWTFSVGT